MSALQTASFSRGGAGGGGGQVGPQGLAEGEAERRAVGEDAGGEIALRDEPHHAPVLLDRDGPDPLLDHDAGRLAARCAAVERDEVARDVLLDRRHEGYSSPEECNLRARGAPFPRRGAGYWGVRRAVERTPAPRFPPRPGP